MYFCPFSVIISADFLTNSAVTGGWAEADDDFDAASFAEETDDASVPSYTSGASSAMRT